MRHRSAWPVVGFLSATLASMALAQEPPPGPTPPAAAGVRLAYKFRPGAVQRYRYSTAGTLIMDLSKAGRVAEAAGVPGSISFDISAQYDVILRIKRVASDGTATAQFSIDNLKAVCRHPELQVAARLQDGLLTVTADGERVPLRGGRGGKPFAGQVFEARIATTGEVLDATGSATNALRQSFGGDGPEQLFLLVFMIPEAEVLVVPADPVQVGQTWEEPARPAADAPALRGAEATPKVTLKALDTLKELQKRGVRQIAVIDTRVESSVAGDAIVAGPGGAASQKDTLLSTGTTLFDITNGELRRGEYTVHFGLEGAAALDAGPGGQGPSSIGVAGTLRTTVTLLPNTPTPKPSRRSGRRR